ncbi:MAG TPA: ribonuclease III domain-containing protein [Tissierellaceae bacterium]|nr:ribonuclease III domain-containing protein [Tissierellaceae bacterium]
MEESVIMGNKWNIFRKANNRLTEEDILLLSPLQLAYIGDGVYELLIRTFVLERDLSVKDLHKSTTDYVKAETQAKIIHELEDILTDKEKSIVKRGRNAKSNTTPKNTDMIDYKHSTGFESLFGYLYLKGEDERVFELFEEIMGIQI